MVGCLGCSCDLLLILGLRQLVSILGGERGVGLGAGA